jgi:hypothetical protein
VVQGVTHNHEPVLSATAETSISWQFGFFDDTLGYLGFCPSNSYYFILETTERFYRLSAFNPL